DVAQRLPKALAIGTGEIGIDDILVFLRRVLGILDRTIGPPLEPVGVLREPGVIERALNGEIERDLHSMLGAGRDQAAEVIERAELGMDRVVAALGRADRIEASWIAGRRAQRIVAPLAVGAADRLAGRGIGRI